MRNALVVCGRELGSAFRRPLAYAVLGAWVGLVGLLTLWFDDVLAGGIASMRRPFFWMGACLLLLVPASTMRLIAEERRSQTLLVLQSLQMGPVELVVGKWLSAVALVAAALALTLPWPAMLAAYGAVDVGPLLGGYLGLLLGGATLAAVGTASSAATDSQVVAFLLALVACLVPWLVGLALPLVPADQVALVQPLTFEYHFSNLARGVLDTRSLVFFGAVTTVALRLAVHLLEQRRLA